MWLHLTITTKLKSCTRHPPFSLMVDSNDPNSNYFPPSTVSKPFGDLNLNTVLL